VAYEAHRFESGFLEKGLRVNAEVPTRNSRNSIRR
jgi:hypothetical protein